jgi:probable phosphoglycerate mutase
MSQQLPLTYLARHGETAWSLTGQHTGRNEIPLTQRGEREAQSLGQRLKDVAFAQVFTSPLGRAVRTCELAGFGKIATIDPDMLEWDYGDYSGKTIAEIRRQRPDWNLFRDGCPGGETAADVGKRADHVLARVRAIEGNIVLFSHGHFLRVFAARWLGLDPTAARYWHLGTAGLCVLGYEHTRNEPVIRVWNDSGHTSAG